MQAGNDNKMARPGMTKKGGASVMVHEPTAFPGRAVAKGDTISNPTALEIARAKKTPYGSVITRVEKPKAKKDAGGGDAPADE